MSGILQLINTFPSGGFAVKNSLRLRSSASAYLSRTITLSATWTLSVWVKRGALGVTSPIFGASVLFNSNDTLTAGTLTTTAVYRDPSAWYHIVVSNSGCYVNGVSVGSTATGILVSPLIGSNAINYFDGYLAELNFVDGQALTPSSFGAFDATSGVWQATKYSGTYGTNGFYLKFSDTTSTTTLCYDYSGNSNNWTPNNISLTAGSTYDSMLDSPTNYDNGGNGVGNYCVMNPLDTSGSTINANLSVNTVGYSLYGTTRATFGMSSGKWYWEVTPTSFGDGGTIGISTASAAISAQLGANAYGWGYLNGGSTYTNSSASSYGASYTTNDVIGVAFDADAGTLTFYKNNASQGTAFSGLTSGPYFPTVSDNGGGSTGSVFAVTFGQRPFAYTPPTGFKALNTQNLPAPSIQNGSNFMAATLYTGNGATQNIINANNCVSFQPDFVWVKNRANSGADHALVDSVRGAAYWLASNLTQAESNNTAMVTSINSTGFTVGASNMTNQSGVGLVGWQWKAGGTAVTNTAGSITSQVSANTTAGFSVVTYTGNGTNPGATIGHGLGVTPSMIITKARSTTGEWPSYHVSIGVTNTLYLNATYAASTYVNRFSAVSSTTFTTGSNGSELNTNGTTYVAYCFAAITGYSAFGSYTGNGSADGPFVYTGFRPRYVLFKNTTDGTVNWWVFDSSRNTYNVVNTGLTTNLSGSESTNTAFNMDLLSNGFKLRNTNNSQNTSGATYIYAAFAESPLKFSLAR